MDAALSAAIMCQLPADKAAAIMSKLPAKAAAIMSKLPPAKAADIMRQLPFAKTAAAIMSKLPADKAAAIMSKLPADKATAIMCKLPADKAAAIMCKLPADKAAAMFLIGNPNKKTSNNDRQWLSKASASKPMAEASSSEAEASSSEAEATSSEAKATSSKITVELGYVKNWRLLVGWGKKNNIEFYYSESNGKRQNFVTMFLSQLELLLGRLKDDKYSGALVLILIEKGIISKKEITDHFPNSMKIVFCLPRLEKEEFNKFLDYMKEDAIFFEPKDGVTSAIIHSNQEDRFRSLLNDWEANIIR
jgi:hypothetical protein